jgi:hypothetical protein
MFMYAFVVAVYKCSLRVRILLMSMDSCSEHVDRSPVRMSLMRRLFSNLVVADDDAGHTLQSIVTLVMQGGLDPLMHPVL